MFIFNFIKRFLLLLQNYFKSFLLIVFTIWLFIPSDNNEIIKAEYNLAKVYITGEIMIVDKIVEELREIYFDDSIKGVLLIIDSGGGAVDKSVEISDIVKKIREKKPVVSYASGTLASGSLYSAIWSNEIIANRGSLVGSIGVLFSGINYEKLSEFLGISSQVLKMGKYKESGTASREWTSYEKEELQKIMKDTYETFVSDVATARKLDISKKDIFADAHIFTARQAQEVGLVDSLGILFDAEVHLENIVKNSNPLFMPVWEKESEMDKFIKEFSSEIFSKISLFFEPRLK